MHINHHVMTLANSIIGVGVLAMPYCFQKCGIILSIFLLLLSNLITRVCCHFLIKCSLLTRRRSIEFLALHSFGTSGKLLVELMIVGYMIGTCVAYFVVLGDLGPQVLSTWFNIDPSHNIREWLMVVVTLFCILPLGMLKNVDSLATVCTVSIVFYFCLVIKIVFESEHHILSNDWEDKIVYWRPAGLLQCLPIFSMALSCQMQVFEVFKSINNQSVEKLDDIVKNALTICCVVYILSGLFGYIAFCNREFSGNILTVFSPTFASDVIRIGFLLSVCFSFPLVIFPCRASIFSFMYKKDSSHFIPEGPFRGITIFIIGFSLFIALLIPSIELVIGLVGSTIGIAICIMFPAACYKRIIKKESSERTLAQLILAGGFILMILGTYANLNAIDEKRSGAHLASDLQKIPDMQPPTLLVRLTEDPIVIKPKNISKILQPPSNVNDRKRSPVSPQPEPEVLMKEPEVPLKVVPLEDKKIEDEQHKKLDEQKDIELKKTKDELKLTKRLLEKKAGQLREAQDLVVGKLGEVVEKVEEIAKEIKEDKEEEVAVVKEVPKVEDILLKVQEIKKTIEKEKSSNDTFVIPKDSLMDRLTKNGSKNGFEIKADRKVDVVNEKKVEVIGTRDDANNEVKEDVGEGKAKPVPLAVLINSSKVEILNMKKIEPKVIDKKEDSNVEAIRRDLLEEKQPLELEEKQPADDVPDPIQDKKDGGKQDAEDQLEKKDSVVLQEERIEEKQVVDSSDLKKLDDPPSIVKRSVDTQEDCKKKPSTKHNDET